MENSKIEWTDHTANFWWGCFKVSPGCANCYAESWSRRWGKTIWGPPSTTEREYKKSAWVDVPRWNVKAMNDGVRRRVFVQSMADFFEDHPQVVSWRNDALSLMEECTHLDFQVLTKRPENITRMPPTKWRPHKWGRIPDHIWIGTSVENQEQANKRIPELLKVSAKIRFLSMEPLLSPVNILNLLTSTPCPNCGNLDGEAGRCYCGSDIKPEIHWVITGGESGVHARPLNPNWVRSIRDQCLAAGVAFFHKQNGEWASVSEVEGAGAHHYFGDGATVQRVGKRVAGRLLDGVEWNQHPTSEAIR